MTANKKKHTALKTVRNILLILFAVCVIAAGAVTLRGYHMYTCALERLPETETPGRQMKGGR